MIVSGGWPRDTPRPQLEAAANDFLAKYADTFRDVTAPTQIRAPFVRASTVNLEFNDHDDTWAFFKKLKLKEKDDTGLTVNNVRIWGTVDKPPTLRLKDRNVRRAAAFLRQKLALGEAENALDIEWKLGIIWVGNARVARIHQETNLMKFNTQHLNSIGHPPGDFLKEWDTFCKQGEQDEW